LIDLLFNPFSHGVGHIGHALFPRHITPKVMKWKKFAKIC
jgi:hypothetical protein